jgi:hypothetical protein
MQLAQALMCADMLREEHENHGAGADEDPDGERRPEPARRTPAPPGLEKFDGMRIVAANFETETRHDANSPWSNQDDALVSRLETRARR